MDGLALSSVALQEPWRLWTGHLVHFGAAHAAANAIALAAPMALFPRRERWLLALALLAVPPLLSLLVLPHLGGGEYRGASGLACALWALAGLRLAGQRTTGGLGLALLAGLALKVGLEAGLGTSLALQPEGWTILPAAHVWGAALGLAFGLMPALGPAPRAAAAGGRWS